MWHTTTTSFIIQSCNQGNVLGGFNNASLLSIGQLCNNECIALFDKRHLRVFKHRILILKGQRNWTDGLCDVKIKPQQQQLNVIIRKDKTKHDLAEYLHKCAFSPSLTTFQKTIKKVILLLGQVLKIYILNK